MLMKMSKSAHENFAKTFKKYESGKKILRSGTSHGKLKVKNNDQPAEASM